MPPKHEAAVLCAVGSPLAIVERDSPEPGPEEVLIETKAIAGNPADHMMRDSGLPPASSFPAVLGEDIAGIVVKHGSGVVLAECPAIGSRVLALATSLCHDGSPDHGAFEKYALARTEGVVALPNDITFEQGAMMPLATLAALSAYTTMGMSLDTKYTPEDKEAILIWGASSSVGSLAVQSAKSLGFAVFATTGAKNLEFVKSLGADAVFDHRSATVVTDIVAEAKVDGVALRTAHTVFKDGLLPTVNILKETRGDQPARVASAHPLMRDTPSLDHFDINFTFPPAEPEERNAYPSLLQCVAEERVRHADCGSESQIADCSRGNLRSEQCSGYAGRGSEWSQTCCILLKKEMV